MNDSEIFSRLRCGRRIGRMLLHVPVAMGAGLVLPALSFAGEKAAAAPDPGDTAWMMVSTALVLLMLPGLALFYGGMVRKKNVLSSMMHSFVAMAVIGLQWVVIGYTLSFGPDVGHFVGGLGSAFLKGIGPATLHGTIPLYIFVMFQGMFAIITPALISGAVAERMKFSTYVVFILIWSTVVYDPIAHWVWGTGGWLLNLGALDFAGGTVVHVSSGISALAAVVILGRRKGFLKTAFFPHNLTLTLLGAGLLWFGWFGFNAGSALASNGSAALAFTNTQIAAAAASLSWMFTEWRVQKQPSALGAASGIVAGLVAITPAAGFVTPPWAIVIGLAAGVICYFAVMLKSRAGYDDSLDAFGVHGVGGTFGAIATGLFATVGGTGLIGGNGRQLLVQLTAVGATALYAFVLTLVILWVLDKTMGIRVSDEEELRGLDETQHGEHGYHD
ncbi:MAG: ammonium transporter [Deltaproteobacteria bacterium]|nr:ammonium transporter [Deltaproteobacteria bacterium]